MTGAMYAAISGMRNHMNKLNVIGNNVANVNTMGFKNGRMLFNTALYTSMRGGSDGTTTVGGRNPAQIGYGSQIGSIDLDMGTGTYTPTGRPMDCMIDGDGFFLVGDKTVAGTIDPTNPSSLKNLTMTRVGNFGFDANGYLVDGAGNPVYGFLTTGVNADGKPIVSDQLVPIRYPRVQEDPNNPGKFTVAYPTAQQGQALEDNVGQDPDKPNPVGKFDSISIDEKTGQITGTCKDTGETIAIGFLAVGNVTNPNGVTQLAGSYYQAGPGSGDLTVSILGGAHKELGITHVNGSMAQNQDDISNIMRIDGGGASKYWTNGLEGSKTDLATEIAEMITTQRGYQANTRIITVTDTMLEELVNIKR